MFFIYLIRELRRRARQAFIIALGLALGIGLTIAVTAASAGVKTAQDSVLHSLYGVGTDMTVTNDAASKNTGGPSFSFSGPQTGGSSGTKTSTGTSDSLNSAPGASTLTAAELAKVKAVSGVSTATGSLSLIDFDISGTISQQATQNPSTTTGGGPGGAERGGGNAPSFGFNGPAGVSGNISPTTVAGVDTTDLASGPMAALTLAGGRELTSADAKADNVVLSASYASTNKLKVGSTKTFGGKTFTVVGLVSGSTASDAYIPLGIAQTLSGQSGAVSTIYVKAGNSTQIDAVAAAIKKDVSGTTVTTSADLADSITGSLKSTSDLANSLGRYLAIAVLLAAFAVAALFTVSAVGRRVREFGTLKALGWTSRRVIRQVLGEAIVTGLIGGALGIVLGVGAAEVIDRVAPTLSASVGSSATAPTSGAGIPGGGAGGAGGGGRGGFGAASSPATTVHLTAPVSLNVLLLAVALAVLGGLIAGGFGGWRASALRPADALRKIA
ncbi:MAG TPA: FtsX-like permease family protein [Actinocrinis sp.]|nr:FtsX-like permease family protein [Actinocrinis sp.]